MRILWDQKMSILFKLNIERCYLFVLLSRFPMRFSNVSFGINTKCIVSSKCKAHRMNTSSFQCQSHFSCLHRYRNHTMLHQTIRHFHWMYNYFPLQKAWEWFLCAEKCLFVSAIYLWRCKNQTKATYPENCSSRQRCTFLLFMAFEHFLFKRGSTLQ